MLFDSGNSCFAHNASHQEHRVAYR